nr:MAG TPA: hypothetical protein [Crassvirales sp.]
MEKIIYIWPSREYLKELNKLLFLNRMLKFHSF